MDPDEFGSVRLQPRLGRYGTLRYRYLNTLGKRLELVRGELHGGCALRDERHYGDTGMAAHHRTVHQGGVQAFQVP